MGHGALFLHCCKCLLAGYGLTPMDESSVTALWRRTLGTWAVTYSLDLVVVFAFGVVPFSRVVNALHVVYHHVPPMAVVICSLPHALGWAGTEMMLSYPTQNVLLQVIGWSGLHSLNEALMCLQRVDAMPRGRGRGLLSTRPVIVFELAYKCVVFALFGTMASLAALRALLWAATASECAAHHSAVGCIISSPLCWGLLIGSAFVVVMYPGMAQRSFAKLLGVASGRLDGIPPAATRE